MLRIENLPAFADAQALLPEDPDLRLAITLLVLQAFSAGQLDGMTRTQSIALDSMHELAGKLLPANENSTIPQHTR